MQAEPATVPTGHLRSADSAGVSAGYATDVRPAAATAAAARRAGQTRLLLDAPIASTLLAPAPPNVVAVTAPTAVSMAEAWYVIRLCIDSLAGLARVFPLVPMSQLLLASSP